MMRKNVSAERCEDTQPLLKAPNDPPPSPSAAQGGWSELDESSATTAPVSLEDALCVVDASGRHRKLVWMASAACCACGGMGGGMAPFLMDPISSEGQYSSWEKGAFASAIFTGMWVGSFAAGLADAIGPGRLMTLSLIGLLAGGATPVASTALAIVFSSRFLVGASLCITYQASNTYVAESVPTALRSSYLSSIHIAIAVGGILTTSLGVGAQAAEWSWRTLLALNTAPALIALAVIAPLVSRRESPRWVLVSKGPAAAERLLRTISRANGRAEGAVPSLRVEVATDGSGLVARSGASGRSELELSSVAPNATTQGEGDASAAAAPSPSLGDAGGGVHAAAATSPSTAVRIPAGQHPPRDTFSGGERLRELCRLWRLFAVGAVLAFSLNFGTKGSEIFLGDYVAELGVPSLKRGIYFATAFGKIGGDLVNIGLGTRLGRLRCLQMGYVGAALCTLALALPAVGRHAPLLVAAALLQGVFVDLLWCNVYIYLTERFPTTVRSTGFGVSMGLGRFGGVLSSGLGGVLPSKQTAFLIYGVALLSGAAVSLLLRVETAKLALVDASV